MAIASWEKHAVLLPEESREEFALKLRFSTNGRYLASRSRDGSIDIWDVANRRRLTRWSVRSMLKQYSRVPLQIHETIFEGNGQARPEVRFPVMLRYRVDHQTSARWAGAWKNHLFLIAAERFGGATERPRP